MPSMVTFEERSRAPFTCTPEPCAFEDQQIHWIAAVQRQVDDSFLGNDIADGGVLDLQRFNGDFHVDHLRACADLERHVNRQGRIDYEHIPALPLCPETLHLDGDGVVADRERWERKEAGVGGGL